MKISQYLKFVIPLVLAFLLVSCQKADPPPGTPVTVQRVLSGQTVEVRRQNGQIPVIETVRLLGIEAPDLKQDPWGTEAKAYLQQWLENQPVLLESDVETTDSYQRRLGYLWKDNILVNEQLVKEGYVLANSRWPNTQYEQRLADAQIWARIMKRGIWHPQQPLRQTPAEFRRTQRS